MSYQIAALLDRLSGATPILLTMTLAATVAALAVMVLRLLLKRAPKQWIILLWLFVFLRMLLPGGYGEGFFSLIPEPVTSGRAAEYILEAAGAGTEDPAPAYQTTDLPPDPDGALAGPMPAVESPDRSGEKHAPALITPGMLIPVVWLAGTAGMLLWSVIAYARVRRRVAEAVRTEAGDIWEVYETDAIDAPFVLGTDIYLPVGLAEADRKYVLLHEQAHAERYDAALKTVAWIALSVHWFNPVLWLAYRLFCRDVEAACDQRVVDGFAPETRREDVAGYAAALLHLGRRERLPQTVLPFGEENAKGRIKNVLSYKKPAKWLAVLAAVLCVATVCGIMFNGPAGEPPSPQPETAAESGILLPPEPVADPLPEADRDAAPEEETPAEAAANEAAVAPAPAVPTSIRTPAAAPSAGAVRSAGKPASVQPPASTAGADAPGTDDRESAPPAETVGLNGAAEGEGTGETASVLPAPGETDNGPSEGDTVQLSPAPAPAERRTMPESLDLTFLPPEGEN